MSQAGVKADLKENAVMFLTSSGWPQMHDAAGADLELQIAVPLPSQVRSSLVLGINQVYTVLGTEPKVLCLLGKHIANFVISPAPNVILPRCI